MACRQLLDVRLLVEQANRECPLPHFRAAVVTGEVVSCTTPDRYAGAGTRWRCACGVIWRQYCNISGLGWKPDGWRMTKRRAARQHLRWHDDLKRAETIASTLTSVDRQWLASVDPTASPRSVDSQ